MNSILSGSELPTFFFNKKLMDKLTDLIERSLEGSEYFLIELNSRGEKRTKVLEVYVDSKGDVNLDALGELNKLFWSKMEEYDYNEEFSKVIVSSPGIDRPFRYIKQLHKHIGRLFTAKDSAGNAIEGTLTNVNEEKDEITVEKSNTKGKKSTAQMPEIFILKFSDLSDSKIKIKF